ERGWRLCAVEPMVVPFQRLQRNYDGFSNVTCLRCAVGHVDGEMNLYTLGMPRTDSLDDHLASFSLDVIRRHWRSIPDLDKRIKIEAVPCLTFASVIARSSLNRIDMLQIDTEGYDYEILKMVFAAGYRPPLLAFEWQHLSAREMEECKSDLLTRGYSWLLSKSDVIAVRETALGDRRELR